ncbi:hypothetical protein AK812_SmicGene32755 [Symbiodinium microadriaticum]|uniref:Uncharacterized protein n=1 Tax=Symbiodinium microadriaticum TaxID=2951 RepID=A0A1Q9CTB8_SYMMI|nr:hypothetical protein AK812_SmicGene32755 [Symbiodinium microadriaticum]
MGNSDSHAVFADGVRRLVDEEISETEDAFWSSLFSVPLSVEDIFEVVGPEAVRTLRKKRPKNLQDVCAHRAVPRRLVDEEISETEDASILWRRGEKGTFGGQPAPFAEDLRLLGE